METIVLNDQSIEPNDEIVFSHLGDKRVYWEKMMNLLSDNPQGVNGGWRYYNDGKSWLFRGLKKDKIVFWVGVLEGYFRVSFYLSGKAEPLIEKSNLPEKIKKDFIATRGEKFRSIRFEINSAEDIENLRKLIDIKLKVK
jgi:hypothetical protein